ncbi:MAG: polysaccharide deacetylase family protein [Candidatus Acidiferrum sp.]
MNPLLAAVPAALAASGCLTAYAACNPRSRLFGSTIRTTNSPAKLAITFDDGPNPAITPRLLDLLERYDARATFFVIGRFVNACPVLTREIAARGHALGNHSSTHPNLFLLTPGQVKDQLTRCTQDVAAAAGSPPKWFRPPFGMRNPWVIPAAAALGQRTVMWTLISGDWRAPSAEWLIPRWEPIVERARRLRRIPAGAEKPAHGDILCLHDGDHHALNGDRTPTLAALEYWLPRWRDLGLEFVTIDEAVLGPAT